MTPTSMNSPAFSPRFAATAASRADSCHDSCRPTRRRPIAVARLVEHYIGTGGHGLEDRRRRRPALQRALRTDSPIYGRVYAPILKPSPATRRACATCCSPIPEVEYQVLLGADLPPRAKPYSVEEVTEAVASLHPGIELAECRFVHDDKFPPLPPSSPTAPAPARSAMDLRSQIGARATSQASRSCSVQRHAAPPRHGGRALDHPMVPLTWLANELSRTGIGMKAGQIVSTGHAHWHAAAKTRRDFCRRFRSVRDRAGDLPVRVAPHSFRSAAAKTCSSSCLTSSSDCALRAARHIATVPSTEATISVANRRARAVRHALAPQAGSMISLPVGKDAVRPDRATPAATQDPARLPASLTYCSTATANTGHPAWNLVFSSVCRHSAMKARRPVHARRGSRSDAVTVR